MKNLKPSLSLKKEFNSIQKKTSNESKQNKNFEELFYSYMEKYFESFLNPTLETIQQKYDELAKEVKTITRQIASAKKNKKNYLLRKSTEYENILSIILEEIKAKRYCDLTVRKIRDIYIQLYSRQIKDYKIKRIIETALSFGDLAQYNKANYKIGKKGYYRVLYAGENLSM